MPIELVMMDHDGVIVDSDGDIYQAVGDLLFTHPLFGRRRIPSFLDFLEFFRLPGDEWFGSHGFDFPPEVIKKTLRRAPDQAAMFSTVPPMLQRLRKKSKLPIVVVSAGDQPRVERQLAEGRISHHFELVLGEISDKAMAITFFCSAFGIKPENAVYIGDRPSDMEDGRAAGVTPIGFANDQPVMEDILSAAGAHYCVMDHQALGDLLVELARF